jgi:catechol 2,3-dioxygenase-like lactoylglutathione lyase family enzyme
MQYAEIRFAFYARDFARSLRFYQETIGLLQTGGWDRPDGKGALLTVPSERPGGIAAVVEILGAAEGAPYSGPAPSGLSLGLRLASLEALEAAYRRLEQAAAPLAGPPVDHPWGHRSFVLTDPDGIQIHLYAEL